MRMGWCLMILLVVASPSVVCADDPPEPIIDYQDDLCSLDPLCGGAGGGGGVSKCLNCATKRIGWGNKQAAACCDDNAGHCQNYKVSGWTISSERYRNCWVTKPAGGDEQCRGKMDC